MMESVGESTLVRSLPSSTRDPVSACYMAVRVDTDHTVHSATQQPSFLICASSAKDVPELDSIEESWENIRSSACLLLALYKAGWRQFEADVVLGPTSLARTIVYATHPHEATSEIPSRLHSHTCTFGTAVPDDALRRPHVPPM